MSKRELSKCREWERERRDRLKTCFTALGRLLPCYDPSVVLSKLEILQRAAACIEELQLKNTKYVNGKIDGDVNRQETDDLLKLQDRVKKLLSRNEQLANLLRDAGLKVPTECGNVRTFEPRLWSNRITPERAEQLRNKLLEKASKDQTDNNHKTNERIKRKRKPLQKLKKNNNNNNKKKKNTNHIIKKAECINSEQKKATRNNKKGQNVVKNINIIKKKKIIRNKKKILHDVPAAFPAAVPVTVLGPGTLILANGNVVPVLPPVQQIITPTLVSHAQASVILMRQHSLSLLPALRPKIASGVTRTTTVNKVPIPALSSRHALKSFVQRQRQQSSANHNYINNNNGTKATTTTTTPTTTTTTTILDQKKIAKKVNTNCSVSVTSNTPTQPLINTNALLVTTTASRIHNNKHNSSSIVATSTIVTNAEAINQKPEMEAMAAKKVAMMPSDNNIIINSSMNNKASVSVSYTIDSLCETSNAPSGQFIELQLPSSSQTQTQTITNVQSNSNIIAKDTKQSIDKHDKMAEGKPIENVAKDDIIAVREMILKAASPTLPPPPVQTGAAAPTVNVNVAASPPPHSELSNDIFASLQVPTGGQHPESMSPTAAFLLAFPLVSTLNGGRVTEVLVEDTPDSRQGTPTTLLQIGGPLDTTTQQQAPTTGSTSTLRQRQPQPQPIIVGATSRQPTPPHLLLSSLDGFSFFSSASKDTQQEPQQANPRHLPIPLPPPASNATSYESYNPRACVFEPKKTQQTAVAVVTMSQTQYGAYNPFADITPVSRPPPLYTTCTATGNYQQYPVDDKEEKRLLHKDQQHRAPVNWMTDIRQPTSEFFLPPFSGADNQSFATVPVPEHTKRPPEFVSYEGHHDPHQFSWSSSKQVAPPPPPLPHVPHATSLPTLVGDLALGVERPFADQAKQHRGKDETTGTFLSVSQLVEHAGVHNNKLMEQQRNHRKHHHHHQHQQHQQQQHQHHHQQTHKGHKRHRDKQRQQDYSMDCHHQIQVPTPAAALLNRSHRSSYTAEALISSNQQLYGASASTTAHQYSANISNESQPQQSQPQQHHTSQPQQSQQRQQFPTNGFNYAPSSLLPPAAVGHAPSVEVAVDFGAEGFGQHPKVVPPTFENYAVRSSVLANAHRLTSSSYRTPSAPMEDKRRQSKRVSGQGGRYQSVGSSMPMTMTTTSTTCDTPGMSGFPDLGFLSMSGAIASPILPDEFHTSFLTNTAAPPTVPPPVPPYHSTASASTGYALPAQPAPPPPMPPKHHYGPRQLTADLQPSSSLTNFNLSAIFPEINKPTARLSRSQSSRVNQPEQHHPQQQQGAGAGAHAHPQHQRPADVSLAFPSRLAAAPHHHMAQGKASVAISSPSPSFTAYGVAGPALAFSAPPLPFTRH